MNLDTTSLIALVLVLAVSSGVLCYLVRGASTEELELRAATAMATGPDAYILTTSVEERSSVFQAEYAVFINAVQIPYEDYLLLVIHYGRFPAY